MTLLPSSFLSARLSERRVPWRGALVAGCLVLAACGSSPTGPGQAPAGAAPDARGCVTDYVEGRDYFDHKSTLEHAQNFAVSYHGSYQVLEVKQSDERGLSEKYVLYRCGTPAPAATGDLEGAQQIEIPIRSLFSGSTTHLPLLDELDRIDLLTGVSSAAFVNNAEARARIADGRAVEYAPNQVIDTERVLAARPDVLLTGGVDDPAYQVLRRSGVPVVANAEWLEQSPLGRAEWIKHMAALTGEEAKAEKVFDQIETDYTRVAQTAAGTGAPVTVLPGQMFEGTWSMPGGDSYVAALIEDANATYPWADVPRAGSVSLSLEEVLARGRDAQAWLMSADVQTLADIAADDPRYTEIAAFSDDAVWSNNAKIGPGGGNDYWERGVTRPDLVLADLVMILHPEALPGHQMEFYRKVDR